MKALVVPLAALAALADPICIFQTPAQLAKCQTRYFDWTDSLCPSSLRPDAPAVDVDTSQALPSFGSKGVHTKPNLPRVWGRLHDRSTYKLVQQLVTGAEDFKFRHLTALFRFDQACMSLVMAALCPLLALAAILSLCCKCCRRDRPPLRRRPKLFSVVILILLGLSIYVVYAAGSRTRRVNKAENAGRCLGPRAIQGLTSNRILNVPNGAEEAFSGFIKLVTTLETAREQSHYLLNDYLVNYNTSSLASFTLTAPFAPLLWTGALLEHQYAQQPDVNGIMTNIPTQHALVGYKVLRNLGDFNRRDSGPLSHMYLQLDAAESQLQFDIRPIKKSVRQLVEHLDSISEDIDQVRWTTYTLYPGSGVGASVRLDQ